DRAHRSAETGNLTLLRGRRRGTVRVRIGTGRRGPEERNHAVGIKAQTQNVLANIQEKLSKAGCSLKDVVKATVFLSDIRGFEEMNEAYRAAFAPDFPARSTLEARLARPKFLVEIEVIASRHKRT